MPKPKITPLYIFFYILFSPDTYRILVGIACGVYLMPLLLPENTTVLGRYVLFVMLVCVGWAVSGVPARWVAQKLQAMLSNQ